MLSAALSGFGLSLSLILAIGAQNAFVLRQGILRQHVGPVVAVCAISDAILIVAGVAGFGALVEAVPEVEQFARWGGAVFLVAYGLLSFKRAVMSDEALQSARGTGGSLWATVGTALTLTWANPHVYLDTVVLLGAVAATFEGQRWAFATGAVAASGVFFASLGYGARLLAPLFARPASWRVLDFGVGVLMCAIAYALIAT